MRSPIIVTAFICLSSLLVSAQVTIPAGATASAIVNTLNSAPAGSTVTFSPGTYNVGTIAVPGNKNLTITGPMVTPATVTVNGGFTTNFATGLTVQYIHFNGGTALYTGTGNNSNVSFVHNQVTGIQNVYGVKLDGVLSKTVPIQNVDTNMVIDWNVIGDASSCASTINMIPDNDGNCGGIATHVGNLSHLSIQHNFIYHVSEGMHINQLTEFSPGSTSAVCDYCVIDYNYFLNYHRIAMEIQTGSDYTPITVEHNIALEPISNFWGTFAYSMACCDTGHIQRGYSAPSPALVFNDNIAIVTTPGRPPMGVEWWGVGAIGTNSLIQGNWGNGYSWGYGNGSWQIRNNYICGQYMAIGASNQPGVSGSYIENEERVQPPPAQSGNVVAPSCHTTPSATPTLTQSATGVTMSTTGQNTSIYYTTDGSTPTVNSTLYTGPIAPATGTVVQALAMWGSGIQPKTHPAGFGYVPSPVVSLTYTGQPGTNPVTPPGGGGNGGGGTIPVIPPSAPTIVSAVLSQAQNTNTGVPGATIQFTCIAKYSDGTSGTVPNTAINWVTTNAAVMTVSTTGRVTLVGAGTANVQAQFTAGGVSSPWTVTVTQPTNVPVGTFLVRETLAPGSYDLQVKSDGTHTVAPK